MLKNQWREAGQFILVVLHYITSPVNERVKNLPTMHKTQVQSLGQEDRLE